MKWNDIEKIIADILEAKGFPTLSQRGMGGIVHSVLIYSNSGKEIQTINEELKILKLIEFFKEKKNIKISKIETTENITIQDKNILSAMAWGIEMYYWAIYNKKVIAFEPKPPHPDLTEDFIKVQKEFLEFLRNEQECFFFKGISFIGAIAKTLFDSLNYEGVFTSGKNRKGKAKEYACIYDILKALGFAVTVDSALPDTDSTKYTFIKNCIDYVSKKTVII